MKFLLSALFCGLVVLGLIVNLVSAWLLQGQHGHSHQHHGHSHSHQDHNLRAAYLHVLADALTSVLAIIALLTGKILGWIWMDPAMGIVGALVITKWSHGLLIDTGKILLDRDVNQEAVDEIRTRMEADYYKKLLSDYDEIVHITIEVNKGEGEPCLEVVSD